MSYFRWVVYFALVALMVATCLSSCNTARKSQRHWDKGYRIDSSVFNRNAKNLAKLNFPNWADFCAVYFPASYTVDSSAYLAAKRQYDDLYQKSSDSLKKLDDALKIALEAYERSGDDSATIVTLKKLLANCKAAPVEKIYLPGPGKVVRDSALAVKAAYYEMYIKELETRYVEAEKRLKEQDDRKEGKVNLSWWWLVIAGGLFAALLVLFFKFKL